MSQGKLILILLFSLKLYSTKAAESTFHLVLDIDYTFFHLVDQRVSERTIMASDKRFYEPIAWGIEGIENVLARGMKISFFSGGEEARNISLLKQVKLSDGRSLYEVSQAVYSKKHLKKVASKGRFSERYKKDLLALGFNMDKTLLIDDLANFAPENQKSNLLWIGRTYYHFNDFLEAQKALSIRKKELKFIPKSHDEWFIAKNKMKYVFELILDAKENSKNSKDILKFIQKNKNNYIPYNEALTPEFYNILNQFEAPSVCFRSYKIFLP